MKKGKLRPMSSSSNGNSYPCKSKVEGEVVGSRPHLLCNSPKERKERKSNGRLGS